jgi:hypothetical protein
MQFSPLADKAGVRPTLALCVAACQEPARSTLLICASDPGWRKAEFLSPMSAVIAGAGFPGLAPNCHYFDLAGPVGIVVRHWIVV